MITDKNYNKLSEKVYDVDTNKVTIPVRKNTDILNRYVKVLEAEDNPDNGMQVRTVGAIKGGEVGKSHIIIVYAGIDHLTAI
ncbi:TPA: hypothetical protein TUR75_001312 [Streptococcus equi subsp. zooepidemicus]|uniref:hypothetical protein n=1 Tax=Streptococcus equi TaxID=1336 RepID=UPI0005B741D3|nr:hypothetical protein [Streptococcus equi]KIQ75390.1 hypothetical protein QQ41_08295 [Streptococcus equi subsp. zooepidemicus]KIS05924.1 hypothetical protein AT53_00944 [Streptococcus equi subsp. zooepidemicus Sz5]MCD3423705.1 hypothetical protein [Streptococcus equi subsp. zooepidemicus]MCD3444122.1 hypothetical protein [Streptococcus equi subsp. zooepidemicus]MDI5916686.1 hypothetical protein [Streptococcus equi subsp. zooepidemicus]